MGHDKGDTKLFAPVPFRAFADSRLRGAHFQLLGAIAMHDRMGASGHGCTATHRRLSKLTKLHQTTVTKGIGELIILGYVLAEKSAWDGRRRVYHIVYTDDDFAAFAITSDVKSMAGKPESVAESGEIGGRRVHLRDWKCSDSPDAIYSQIEDNQNKGPAAPEQSDDNCSTASNRSLEGSEASEGGSTILPARDAIQLVKQAAKSRSTTTDETTADIDRAIDTATSLVNNQTNLTNNPGFDDVKPSRALLESRLCLRARGEE